MGGTRAGTNRMQQKYIQIIINTDTYIYNQFPKKKQLQNYPNKYYYKSSQFASTKINIFFSK